MDQRTILIVDDSRLARLMAVSAVSRLRPGWTAVEAADATQALAAAERQPPDIALLDFNMPGKDGLTLAGELRRLHPALPIAIVSANVQDETVARARRLDTSFVPKPLTDEALAAFLARAGDAAA